MASYSVFKAKFKKTIADAIYQEVTSRTAIYYHWFGKENSWQDYLSPFIPSNAIEDSPGEPSDNFRYDLHVRRDILTTKKIKPSDVSYVVRRIDWVSNTVYDDYDDAYDTSTGFGFSPAYSGATRLEDSNFYVLTSQYNVYKCIWNNNNSPSTVMPTGTTPYVFDTADGYKWKFMYTIPVSLRNRFLSNEYMPVSNSLKAQFYSAGEISNIAIQSGGSGYVSGQTTAVITGDGYQEENPYALQNTFLVGSYGDGYSQTPAITIADPIDTYIDFLPEVSVEVGTYVKVLNANNTYTYFYEVISGDKLGVNPPVHTAVSEIAVNGTAQLKCVAQTAEASLAMVNGKIVNMQLDSAGFGYQGEPIVTIETPVNENAVWQSETEVLAGTILKSGLSYYQATTTHTTGTVAPTHTTGTTDNLEYLATDANTRIQADKTEALVSLIISPPTDSVFNFKISNPVPKYTETPFVTIASPDSIYGTTAAAYANIADGKITDIIITPGNEGSGYTVAPAVTIDFPKKTIDSVNDIDAVNDTVEYTNHLLETGDLVVYNNGGGDSIGGLTSGNSYYIIKIDDNLFKLAATREDAEAETPVAINLASGTGINHTFTMTIGASAISILGTGGEIVGYVIDNPGYGYTNCSIEIVDESNAQQGNGAVLVADFNQGNIDTLQSNVELLAVPRAIYTIKMVDQGSGYSTASIEIVGDGSGATAEAQIDGGRITNIYITNPGSGYTWTDIIITGNAGSSGAVARAIMSPLDGHGSNAIDELNANAIVFYSSLSRDKNQGIEINNDYRKVGLIRNLKQFGSNRKFTDDIGSGCVLISGSFDPGNLEHDMLLTKDGYKKYRIVDFNDNQILLSVFNNFTINVGDVLSTDPTNQGKQDASVLQQNITVSSVTERTIDQFSGDFLFFSVRDAYSPTSEQIITVRTIVEI